MKRPTKQTLLLTNSFNGKIPRPRQQSFRTIYGLFHPCSLESQIHPRGSRSSDNTPSKWFSLQDSKSLLPHPDFVVHQSKPFPILRVFKGFPALKLLSKSFFFEKLTENIYSKKNGRNVRFTRFVLERCKPWNPRS